MHRETFFARKTTSISYYYYVSGEFTKFSLFQHSSWSSGHDCYFTRHTGLFSIHQFAGLFSVSPFVWFFIYCFNTFYLLPLVIGSISVHQNSFIQKSDFRCFTHKFIQKKRRCNYTSRINQSYQNESGCWLLVYMYFIDY